MHIHICVYVCIYVYIYIHTCIYIYIERERERKTLIKTKMKPVLWNEKSKPVDWLNELNLRPGKLDQRSAGWSMKAFGDGLVMNSEFCLYHVGNASSSLSVRAEVVHSSNDQCSILVTLRKDHKKVNYDVILNTESFIPKKIGWIIFSSKSNANVLLILYTKSPRALSHQDDVNSSND